MLIKDDLEKRKLGKKQAGIKAVLKKRLVFEKKVGRTRINMKKG